MPTHSNQQFAKTKKIEDQQKVNREGECARKITVSEVVSVTRCECVSVRVRGVASDRLRWFSTRAHSNRNPTVQSPRQPTRRIGFC